MAALHISFLITLQGRSLLAKEVGENCPLSEHFSERCLTAPYVSLALADADELHRKIERLRNRVSSLEDALRVLQATVTDDPHPLLVNDMVEDGSQSRRRTPLNGPPPTREDEEFLDAFGMWVEAGGS